MCLLLAVLAAQRSGPQQLLLGHLLGLAAAHCLACTLEHTHAAKEHAVEMMLDTSLALSLLTVFPVLWNTHATKDQAVEI